MHNFDEIYERILEILKDISPEQLPSYQRRGLKMSNLELVALSLLGEYLGVDSEHDSFRKLPPGYVQKIERSVFNRRRRRLFAHIESIRGQLAEILNRSERVFIVESMALEVCGLSRSGRSTICREEVFSSPDKVYCASQGNNHYGTNHTGFVQRAVSSIAFDISPASMHDVNYQRTSSPNDRLHLNR